MINISKDCHNEGIIISLLSAFLVAVVGHLNRVMKKPAFCICENKDADQLRGNRKADQRLCFRYIYSTIPPLPKSEISKHLAIFCGCAARVVSDLVGNPEDRFSHNEAHLSSCTSK